MRIHHGGNFSYKNRVKNNYTSNKSFRLITCGTTHWNSENWKQFFFAKNVPKYKMYLNDYISKSIQDTVGRYVRWGIGMGVIFLITNRVNKQIIPQTKVWIINVIIKYLAHLMYLRWYYTIEIVKIENNFFSLKMSLNIRCT